MEINVLLTVEVEDESYAIAKGVPIEETSENIATEFDRCGDALTWHVTSSRLIPSPRVLFSDVIQTILARPRNGSGGGIPLSRGEVAMLFLDGHAGDGPGLLDIRSQGYGEDSDWDGLTHEDIFSTDEGPDAAFVWSKWEPLELWPEDYQRNMYGLDSMAN